MTTIKRTDKVELFKTVIDKGGDMYYPGVYGQGRPLPERFLTPEFVRVLEVVAEEVEYATQVLDTSTPSNSQLIVTPGVSQELVIKANQGQNPIEETNLMQKKVTVALAEQAPVKINVNEASIDELIVLNGVGRKIAAKVVEYRDLHPFSNTSDLNDRIPLPLKRDWAEFKDLIEF